MSRLPRIKVEGGDGWYHLHARVTGVRGEYLLEEAECRRELIGLLQRYAKLYQCEMVAFCVMGDHWHALMLFRARYEMNPDQLADIARSFYPGQTGQKFLKTWTDRHWQRFARRIFDVSEFMRNVQMAFARWYNRNHNRKGRFWAERFGSTLLEDEKSVLDCMLYIELNPVRAGIVTLPEDYKGSSEYLRSIGKSDWLMDISRILHADSEQQARRNYRHLLIWRGTEPTKENHASIPREIARQEEARGYKIRGVFLKKTAYLTESLAVGSAAFITDQLAKMRKKRYYLRRKNPVKPKNSPHCALRPQRNC
jgi:REP element-mobilizing transposase RayT